MKARVSRSPLYLGLALAFAACADDDDPQPSPTVDDGGAQDGGTSMPFMDASSSLDAQVDDAARDAEVADAAPVAVGSQGYLLVAELAQGKEAIHAYSLPDLRHTGQLDGVKLGNHLGAIALADGRVVTSDDKSQEIIAIRMDSAGRPQIANRVSADLGTGGVWGCGDAELRYLAISSGRDDTKQVANIVKLDDFTLTPFELSMNVIEGATEELHTTIAGSPPHLFASIGGEIEVYPLDAVLAKTATTPVASVAIETGSHGPIVSHEEEVFYITTKAGAGFDGIETMMPFARAQLIPWDVDGRATGRNARPRLSADGKTIYGAIALTTPVGPELWATREVDLQAVDIDTRAAKRTLLTTGIVSKFQLSRRYALFANVAGNGDFAILVDIEPGSATFQQVVARVPLTALANGPVAGQPTTGKEARGSAITPDGKWAFVSHGGEGKISVIDTAQKSVAGTIQVPTSLAGGGYLFAWQPGSAPMDTCTR